MDWVHELVKIAIIQTIARGPVHIIRSTGPCLVCVLVSAFVQPGYGRLLETLSKLFRLKTLTESVATPVLCATAK